MPLLLSIIFQVWGDNFPALNATLLSADVSHDSYFFPLAPTYRFPPIFKWSMRLDTNPWLCHTEILIPLVFQHISWIFLLISNMEMNFFLLRE